MGAYEGLSHFFEQPLPKYATALGYHESNILILNGQMDQLHRLHPAIYRNLLSCRHQSDRRSPLEYGQDLVASWLFEDYFLKAMQNRDFEIHHAGADRQRLILPNQRTSSSSDYILRSQLGERLPMELVCDYTGFWYRQQKLHLRDNKYLQLRNHRSLLLAISLSSRVQKYTLFDFRRDIVAKKIPSHRPYGGKPAYELEIEQDAQHDLSLADLKESINHLLQKPF